MGAHVPRLANCFCKAIVLVGSIPTVSTSSVSKLDNRSINLNELQHKIKIFEKKYGIYKK
jgi:hypothetical protein